MTKSPETDGSLFPTELTDAKIELSKLPPLDPQKSNNSASVNKPNVLNDVINDSLNDSNINNNTNNDNTDTLNNNNISNNASGDNNSNLNIAGNDNDSNLNNIGSNVTSNINNNDDDSNDDSNNESNTNNNNGVNEDTDQENKKEQGNKDDKEEIKIGDEEADGLLQEQANALIGSIVTSSTNEKESNANASSTRSQNPSQNVSNPNSQQASNQTSQKNSTKGSTTNSVRNTAPISNRSSSSLTSHSYSSTRKTTKTSINRRIGKLPPSRISFNQEMSKIPKDILHNPYVTKRLNIFPARSTNPPKAALSNVEYRNRVIPQKDELTEKILNGEEPEEEPTIEQLKNSANILRIYEKDLIDKSEYLEAKKVAQAFQKTLAKIKKKSSSTEVKTGLESLIAKRNELMIIADDKKEEWDDIIAKYQSDTEAHVNNMKQQHQEKIKQFNSEIPSELTPLFKRNSVSYLTMRSNEKYLALNRHFDEAHKMKLKADEIEEIEREDNFSKMDEFYRKKREQLKQLQQLEIINYRSYADTRKNELIFQKEKSISGPLLRAEKIDKEIKRICEKRGIKQNQLNFDLVDDERVKLIKSKEKENDDIFKHSRGNLQDENKKSSNDDPKEKKEEPRAEEEEKNENGEEESKNNEEEEEKNEKQAINEEETKNEKQEIEEEEEKNEKVVDDDENRKKDEESNT